VADHSERPGHCPACAAELEQLKQRVEDLDRVLASHIRATPATPREVDLKQDYAAVRDTP